MNENHWYPRDPQRWLTDTAWCDQATEVAHNRLTDTYYALGKPIKDDPSRIQLVGKIKDVDYVRVTGCLMELGWRIENGEWRHRRIEETMQATNEKRLKKIAQSKAATEAHIEACRRIREERDKNEADEKRRREERDDKRDDKRDDTLTITRTRTNKEGDCAPLPPTLLEVFDAWNGTEGLSKCLVLSDKRRRTLNVRLGEKFFSENCLAAILRASKSAFCLGDNDRGWKASLDWLISRDVVAKIMEGKYDNNTSTKCSKHVQQRPDRNIGTTNEGKTNEYAGIKSAGMGKMVKADDPQRPAN